MTFLLLTGAGFSHNWGGPLASEVFSQVLSDNDIDEHNRHDCRPASSTTKVRQLASKGWLTRFDEPIVLDDGTTLTTTLRQAIEYLAKTVPKAEHNHEKVLSAADHLTRSAEQNYPMFFARAATLQAIHRNRERVFNPDRKDHHWASA